MTTNLTRHRCTSTRILTSVTIKVYLRITKSIYINPRTRHCIFTHADHTMNLSTGNFLYTTLVMYRRWLGTACTFVKFSCDIHPQVIKENLKFKLSLKTHKWILRLNLTKVRAVPSYLHCLKSPLHLRYLFSRQMPRHRKTFIRLKFNKILIFFINFIIFH